MFWQCLPFKHCFIKLLIIEMNSDIYESLEQFDFIEEEYIQRVENQYSGSIGLFLIKFSFLEHWLDLSIASIINERTDEIGYQVIERLGFANKVDLFFKLCIRAANYKGKRYKAKLKSLRKTVEEINKFRNILAHANWSSINKKKYVRTKVFIDRETGDVKFQSTKLTPAMIKRKVKQVQLLWYKLDQYAESIFVN